MGYTTDFDGEFTLDKPLTAAHVAYLTAFAQTRRMRRDAAITATLPDSLRDAVGLPVGEDGAYFVGSTHNFGQDNTPGILDYNSPPTGQPGLWCQWIPSANGEAIVWDDGEKFYEYEAWIRYLVATFLGPWGYRLNGEISWTGEDPDDRGILEMTDSVLRVKEDGAERSG